MKKIFPPQLDLFKQNVHFYLDRDEKKKNYIGSSFGAFLTFFLFSLCLSYFTIELLNMYDNQRDRFSSQRMVNSDITEFSMKNRNFMSYLEIKYQGSVNGEEFDINQITGDNNKHLHGEPIPVDYQSLRKYITVVLKVRERNKKSSRYIESHFRQCTDHDFTSRGYRSKVKPHYGLCGDFDHDKVRIKN